MLELIFAVLIGVGLFYAILAKNPMSFDDLIDLHWLFPSRKRQLYDLREIQAKINPRGVCLRKGQVNSPWGSHVCDCKGFKYAQMFYGQPLCECGDLYLQHSPMGFPREPVVLNDI